MHNTKRKNKLMADLQANSQNPEIAQTQTHTEREREREREF
jgi:hypothetical protein